MKTRIVSALLVAALATSFTVGCQPRAKRTETGQRAVNDLRSTKTSTASSVKEIDDALAAIDQLRTTADVRQSLAKYQSAVRAVEKAEQRSAERLTNLQASGREYTATWEKQAAEINNADVRASLASRREEVRSQYDALITSSRTVKDSYRPFVTDLQEIETALKIDPTTAGIERLAAPIDEAKATGQKVKADLTAFDAANDRVLMNVSSRPQKD